MVLAALALCAVIFAGLIWALHSQNQRFAREVERLELRHTAERKELLDRIMYLSDKPWQMPDMETAAQPIEDLPVYPEQWVSEVV